METHFTARKFRAHKDTKTQALAAVQRLDRFYDGIVRCDIILSFERTSNSVKTAEINLRVHGATLSATEKSEEFMKSVELAVEKLERQLAKYKTKLRMKEKSTLRKVKEGSLKPKTKRGAASKTKKPSGGEE
jgi:putative sigma-54 modulation protein